MDFETFITVLDDESKMVLYELWEEDYDTNLILLYSRIIQTRKDNFNIYQHPTINYRHIIIRTEILPITFNYDHSKMYRSVSKLIELLIPISCFRQSLIRSVFTFFMECGIDKILNNEYFKIINHEFINDSDIILYDFDTFLDHFELNDDDIEMLRFYHYKTAITEYIKQYYQNNYKPVLK